MNKLLKLSAFIAVAMLTTQFSLHSQSTNNTKKITHELMPEEQSRSNEIGKNFVETPPPSGFAASIAEYERSGAVIIRYPFGIPMTLIKELAKDIKVITIVTGASQENTVKGLYTQAGVKIENCSFMYAPTNSYWTRDYTGWFIQYGTATGSAIGIVDFPYNRPRPLDDEVPKIQAQHLAIQCFGMNVIQTGGNFMSDGYGIAAASHIAYTENPSQTHAQIDLKMKNYLGVTKYHVVNDPNDTYIDHIDCWGKYLAPNKVLIRSVPQSHPRYTALEEVATYFKNQQSGWGTPYKVYRVYTPNNEPYSNSLILNDKVFVPLIGGANDQAALQTYKDAMPGYNVQGFIGNPSTPWESTDALHCRTHEVADTGMLRITHIPILNQQPAKSNFQIKAKVIPSSKLVSFADSVICFYRVNQTGDAPYNSIKMEKQSNENYEYLCEIANISDGNTVEYYLYACDASGRKEFYPFVGKRDPFKFTTTAATNPIINIDSTSIYINSLIGSQATSFFKISNNGNGTLNFTIKTSMTNGESYNWLKISQSSGSIAPNENQTINITANASTTPLGDYKGIISVISNDLTNDTIKIPVLLHVSNINIEEINKCISNIKYYPNPFFNNLEITITVEKTDNYKIVLLDNLGREVKFICNEIINKGHRTFSINTTDLSKGIYFIKISNNNLSKTIKIIK